MERIRGCGQSKQAVSGADVRILRACDSPDCEGEWVRGMFQVSSFMFQVSSFKSSTTTSNGIGQLETRNLKLILWRINERNPPGPPENGIRHRRTAHALPGDPCASRQPGALHISSSADRESRAR